jgi:hypothetical protein
MFGKRSLLISGERAQKRILSNYGPTGVRTDPHPEQEKKYLDAWRQEHLLPAPCILFTSVIELGMAGLKKPQQSVHSKPVDDATANECKHDFTLLMR